MNTPPTPTPPRDKTYFVSDLHLGAPYAGDPRLHEKRIVDLLNHMARDARHIYLLGDVMDYWFEYRTVVPRGHIRFLGTLANLADQGVAITWITGNHDIWLFDYIRDEAGIEVHDGTLERTIDGQPFVLAHGDGLGPQPRSFRFIRALFRNPVAQKLYSAIHPRWTIPFAQGWSRRSRASQPPQPVPWQDNSEPAMIYARRYLDTHDTPPFAFVTGHRHLAIDTTVTSDGGKKSQFVVTGDCFKLFTYAVFDGRTLQIKHFESAKNQD